MREWPVPKRWTRPSAAMASAHQPLACSIAAACVRAMRSITSTAAPIQRTAGAGTVVPVALIGALRGSFVRRGRGARGGGRPAGLAGPELVDDRLRGRRPDAGHAEGHDVE